MERSSQLSARFIRELSDLAERLAARDVIVRSLHAEYSFFGCWQIVASKNDEAIKFFWDNRDSYITVEGSPIRGYSAPNEWKHEAVKSFDKSSDDNPFIFVEDYLTKRFPV